MNLDIVIILEDGRMAGPQAYVLDLIKNRDAKTNMLLLIPKKDNAEFRYRLDEASVNYLEVGMHRPQRSASGLISFLIKFPLDVFKLVALLKQRPNCIVYSAGGSWQIKGILAARIAKVPSVWQMNDTKVPRLVEYIYRLICRLPAGYVYVSEATKNYYENLCKPWALSYVIPSPVDVNKFTLTKKLKKNRLIKVGTVCSVNPIKNLEYFIDIAAEINKITTDSKFEFEIIGPVPRSQRKYYKKLMKQIRENDLDCVKFIGAQRDVPKKLAELDIYICTSHNEASPIAVWEAMLAGLQIVSTDVGDVSDHLRSSGSGVIIPFRDARSAAELVLKLQENSSNYTSEQNQWNYAALHFSASKCADLHNELFNELK